MPTIKQVTRSLTPVLGVGFDKINAVIYDKVCGCHIVKWTGKRSERHLQISNESIVFKLKTEKERKDE